MAVDAELGSVIFGFQRRARRRFDSDATAIAVVMLLASFLIIFAINRIQRWAQTRVPAH